MRIKKFEIDFCGRPLIAEFSDLAEQANGSVMVRYCETIVMATAVMIDNKKEELDHFPLTVDYEEKFYAAGKILGSRFLRREGRPSEEAILNGRMIDRTLRPLFNQKMRNETQVIATTLSIDGQNDPDVLAIFAASLALASSDIPWNGPIGSVRVGKSGDKFIVNPTSKERENCDLELIVCGKGDKINMIEGKASEASEAIVLGALESAIPEIQKLIEFQNKIVKEIGKEKKKFKVAAEPEGFRESFGKNIENDLKNAFSKPQNKEELENTISAAKKKWIEIAVKEFGNEYQSIASDLLEETIDRTVHINVLKESKRVDGRKLDEIRPLFAKAGILPRAHGSGIFFRGQTHIMSVVTLGAPADVLLIEGMEVREKRRFIHHYNFPPFSSGETGRMSGPGRREIGHGALAEKALVAVIPPKEEFPYTIRLVSETMSSNGSSSMGSVCASTLALMDAGVPIKSPVTGIAMGVMLSEEKSPSGEQEYKVLTDIQGPEDHYGDTDFKAAGTGKGITAIQMDVKVEGLTIKILKDLLEDSKKARLKIFETVLQAISEPRKSLSVYAPQIITLTINPEKIRDVIGPGGKTINKITEETGVAIDIEQNGTIFITGQNQTDAQKAKEIIEEITYEPQIGELHKGMVTRIFEFGAMVEIKPNIEGLVHISEIAPFRVNRVTDVLKPGDMVPVKVVGIDEMGRINLSLKEADPNYVKSNTRNNHAPDRYQRGDEE